MTDTKIAKALRGIIESVLGSDPRPRFQRKPDADGYYSEPLHEDEVKAAIEALAEYDAARQSPAPAQAGTVARRTTNPHRGGTQAYLATEHYNEGWNDCLAALASREAQPAAAPTDSLSAALRSLADDT